MIIQTRYFDVHQKRHFRGFSVFCSLKKVAHNERIPHEDPKQDNYIKNPFFSDEERREWAIQLSAPHTMAHKRATRLESIASPLEEAFPQHPMVSLLTTHSHSPVPQEQHSSYSHHRFCADTVSWSAITAQPKMYPHPLKTNSQSQP